MSSQDIERYMKAMHAMQTGIMYLLELDPTPAEPKHVRVGINSAKCDQAAIAKLLMAKGIITEDEYAKAIADEAEHEVKRYELELSQIYGRNITLG